MLTGFVRFSPGNGNAGFSDLPDKRRTGEFLLRPAGTSSIHGGEDSFSAWLAPVRRRAGTAQP